MTNVTIWDGEEFRQVSEAEAKQLVAQDKAQICDGTQDGLSLRYRHQFSGYSNKMMATAGPEPVVVVQAPATPVTEPKSARAEIKTRVMRKGTP